MRNALTKAFLSYWQNIFIILTSCFVVAVIHVAAMYAQFAKDKFLEILGLCVSATFYYFFLITTAYVARMCPNRISLSSLFVIIKTKIIALIYTGIICALFSFLSSIFVFIIRVSLYPEHTSTSLWFDTLSSLISITVSLLIFVSIYFSITSSRSGVTAFFHAILYSCKRIGPFIITAIFCFIVPELLRMCLVYSLLFLPAFFETFTHLFFSSGEDGATMAAMSLVGYAIRNLIYIYFFIAFLVHGENQPSNTH